MCNCSEIGDAGWTGVTGPTKTVRSPPGPSPFSDRIRSQIPKLLVRVLVTAFSLHQGACLGVDPPGANFLIFWLEFCWSLVKSPERRDLNLTNTHTRANLRWPKAARASPSERLCRRNSRIQLGGISSLAWP